jgi:hypothetical protein
MPTIVARIFGHDTAENSSAVEGDGDSPGCNDRPRAASVRVPLAGRPDWDGHDKSKVPVPVQGRIASNEAFSMGRVTA